MGYYVISNLIKERINMTIETMRETINTIKSVDSMKAVKVAFDLSATTQDSIQKITEVVSLIDKNLKSLAVKVMELEKEKDILFELIKGQEKRLDNYEQRKN